MNDEVMLSWDDVAPADSAPMRGQPEAAYIAKLEARLAELEPLVHTLTRTVADLTNELAKWRAKASEATAELAGWRDGTFVHPDNAEREFAAASKPLPDLLASAFRAPALAGPEAWIED